MKPIQSINISSIDSLETYLWQLGLLSISVNTLIATQDKAESIGIFDDDETELSKTVKYQAQKLFICINDLIGHCSARTDMDWPDLMKKIIQTATKSVDSGSKSVAKKKKKTTVKKK